MAQYADCGPPVKICPGDSVQIGYPDTTGGAVGFVWTGPGITNPTLPQQWVRPDSSSWYFLTVTDSAVGIPCGVTVDSVWVEIVASDELPVVSLGADTTICEGDSIILSASVSVTGCSLLWSTGDSSSSIQATSAGAYSVTATYPGGTLHCHSGSDTVVVTVEERDWQDSLDTQNMRDTIFCAGECLMIGVTADPGYLYAWSPTNGLASPSASMTQAQPDGTTSYSLMVTNPANITPGCRELELAVELQEVPCDVQGYVAANGDGTADVLNLGPHTGSVSLSVWDAAGRLVYATEDYQDDWPFVGTASAGVARGLYIFRASVEGECGARVVTGKVVVIR
ncbi:MAG: gliding motility-associated C-terminal domain-containing protein [Bacteroidia bacterium]